MVKVEPPETTWPLPAHCQAAMGAEATVLVSQQHLDEARIDVVDFDRQTPAAVRRGVGAQQPAIAVDHLGREFDVCEAW